MTSGVSTRTSRSAARRRPRRAAAAAAGVAPRSRAVAAGAAALLAAARAPAPCARGAGCRFGRLDNSSLVAVQHQKRQEEGDENAAFHLRVRRNRGAPGRDPAGRADGSGPGGAAPASAATTPWRRRPRARSRRTTGRNRQAPAKIRGNKQLVARESAASATRAPACHRLDGSGSAFDESLDSQLQGSVRLASSNVALRE